MNKKVKDDFETKLEECLKEAAQTIIPPVAESKWRESWLPLEKTIPAEWRGGFMLMGEHTTAYRTYDKMGNQVLIKDMPIYDYKHGITRNYLHITKSGRCFCNLNALPYIPDGVETDKKGIPLVECPCDKAIEHVFEGLSEQERETVYDDEYIVCRNKALAEAGYTVLNISPVKIAKTKKEYHVEEEL